MEHGLPKTGSKSCTTNACLSSGVAMLRAHLGTCSSNLRLCPTAPAQACLQIIGAESTVVDRKSSAKNA